MILAALNLERESWLLLRIGLALVQPLLILLLIAGLVIATAHLLTMIGTRWGDHRTTSKSMYFSMGVHFVLGCGLVALIPEYRTHMLFHIVETPTEPIRVRMSDSLDANPVSGSGGRSRYVEPVPRMDDVEWLRSVAPDDRAPETLQPERAPEFPQFEPRLTPDLAARERPEQPVPEQEIAAAPGELQPARIEPQASAVELTPRPEAQIPIAPRERSEAAGAAPLALPIPERGAAGNVERLSPELSPDRQAADLLVMPAPDGELTTGLGERIERREGPQALPSQSDLLPRNPAQSPGGAGAESQPRMSRSELSPLVLPSQSPGVERARPALPPLSPNAPPLLPDNSIVGRSEMPPLQFDPAVPRMVDPFMRRDERENVPSAYRLRNEEERDRALRNFGGTVETELAVDLALKWLAANQSAAGYWDASVHGAGQAAVTEDGVDRQGAGASADVGVTALAVLAFLGKLNTVDQGEYSENVQRALRWIISRQKVREWSAGIGSTDGYLGGDASDYEGMYCHGMATFALGEAYAMSRDNPQAQWLREPLVKAVNFILDTQMPDGSWRYLKGQPQGDMSMFGWQLMALKSAEAAGIPIDAAYKRRMERFLVAHRQGTAGGLAGYQLNYPPTAAMTAEAMYCRHILGVATDEAQTREAVAYLLAEVPQRTTLNLYYWYYGTLAMFQRGGPEWERWNVAVRDVLVSEQHRTGELTGSWDPRDVWGPYGGRIYSTAIATLSLEVYYRYLPLYRLNQPPDQAPDPSRPE